jgi:very-short-patch-repair endonuclease
MLTTNELQNKLEYIASQYFDEKKSVPVIAQALGTYPNKIRRLLIGAGYSLRNKSDAQIIALQTGRIAHPTKGTRRSEDTKDAIANSMANSWSKISKKELDRRKKLCRKKWHDMPKSQKQTMQEKAALAIKNTIKNGSKPEKFLMKKLQEHQYKYIFHAKNLISEGKNYEFDFYLPELNTVIEIDGHFHRNSIWGRERLQHMQELDDRKNKLLLDNGYCIIRYQYEGKEATRVGLNNMWSIIEPKIRKIKTKFPKKNERLIKLEGN